MPLVAYGHSWVAGDGSSRPDRCFVEVLARRLGMPAINLGVGGSSSPHTANCVMSQGVPAADLCVVMTGLNDARLAGTGSEALDAYRQAVEVIVSRCAASGARVLVVEQPPLVDYSQHAPHDRGSTEAIDLYNRVLRRLLPAEMLVTVADWDAATMLAPDTVHPNDAGHAAIARAVAAAYEAASIGRTSPVHD